MNIGLRPAAPEKVSRWDLIVGQEKVGEMKSGESEYGGNRFHVILSFPGVNGLVQGHGPTEEAAILTALEKGKADAHAKLVQIASLEARLGLETAEGAEG